MNYYSHLYLLFSIRFIVSSLFMFEQASEFTLFLCIRIIRLQTDDIIE